MIRDLKELLQPGPFADLELAMVGSGYGPTDIRRMSKLGMTIEEIKTVLKRGKRELNMKEIEIKETATVKPFYMVYVIGEGSPTISYDNAEEASKEARRLSLQEQKAAYVLKSVQGYEFCYGISEINVEG